MSEEIEISEHHDEEYTQAFEEEDDTAPDNGDDTEAEGDDSGGGDDADEDAGEHDDADDDPEEDAGKPEPKPAAKQKPEPEPEADASRQTYDDVLGDMKERLAALKEQYRDGELSEDEYEDARDQLFEEREKVKIEKAKAEIVYEQRYQWAKEQWDVDLREFVTQNKDVYQNDVVYTAFAGILTQLNSTPEGSKLSNRKLLKAAHDKVLSAFGAGKQRQAEKKKKVDAVHSHTTRGKAEIKRVKDNNDYYAAFNED